jgi:hypothetical protein
MYYTQPLKVHGGKTTLTGLSFSLTYPQERKRKRKTKINNGAHLQETTHEVGQAMGSDANGKTQLETFWNNETQNVLAYFESMRRTLNAKPTRNMLIGDTVQQAATHDLASVKKDMSELASILEASKVDTMARFFAERRLSSLYGYYYGEATDLDQETPDATAKLLGDSAKELICQEHLDASNSSSLISDDTKLKKLTILAAQDTALLQETTQILRRQARELCEKRMSSSS